MCKDIHSTVQAYFSDIDSQYDVKFKKILGASCGLIYIFVNFYGVERCVQFLLMHAFESKLRVLQKQHKVAPSIF